MPKKKMWVEWDDGAELSQSHKGPGNYSPLTRDGDRNLGQVTLSDYDDYDDDDAPDISGLVPLALVVIAGLAAGAAGAKAARQTKDGKKTRRSNRSSEIPADAAPAGWYEMESDASQLRYWDGSAWTDDFAHRRSSASALPADWYPDPANGTRLRYWDGHGWTHHIEPRPGATATPADWYPDPSHASQLRYWDGLSWTSHVSPTEGTASVALPPELSRGLDVATANTEGRIRMSTEEWQAHVRAWMAAGAIEHGLWLRLSHAYISDADQPTLDAQQQMEELTPEQAKHHIRLMLESNPSLRGGIGLTEFMKLFDGSMVLGQEQHVVSSPSKTHTLRAA